jgi:serine/threonine protein kinase
VIAERYGLETVLGQGGMGRVWKAYDRHLNKHVVVKTVLTPDDDLRSALQKEAEVLINIRHPNIVAVIDFFMVEKELCYVMEFVSGPSWADEIEEPETRRLVLPMSAEQALTKVKALLPAFEYLHGLNPPIIYCDFKPANVKSMKLPNGETVEVLLDFGTAYLYDPECRRSQRAVRRAITHPCCASRPR